MLSLQLQTKNTPAKADPFHRDQRAVLLTELRVHEAEAAAAAALGDLPRAARGILKALDCERRANTLGPQVLQLIKPRP
ncbi:MAG: hypothetical protein DCF24_02965 [Cyanobium sp.]|nr:MAG: hypothetical protein DCF24_02965 [Cyanobium sp.]PZV04421.1 MAG: hypothetical protein DCF23_06390 [Cyanobium sp.]